MESAESLASRNVVTAPKGSLRRYNAEPKGKTEGMSRHAISRPVSLTTQTEITAHYSGHEVAICRMPVCIAEICGAPAAGTDIDWF
jgi:hypothetical protein